MYEFSVPEAEHINLVENPNVVFSLAIGLVGDAAAALASEVEHWPGEGATPAAVRFAATFFDAYIDTRLDPSLREEFSLLGAASYLLANLPGNASLLVRRMDEPHNDEAAGLDWLLWRLLRSDYAIGIEDEIKHEGAAAILAGFEEFLRGESDAKGPLELAQQLRREAYAGGSGRVVLYADLAVATLKSKVANASSSLLRQYSDLPLEDWLPTLRKPSFVRELWPAQRRLCEAGVMAGRSAVVQMPTSAGKTRATELIIRSSFLSGRANFAVIVAPFRALCHDIRSDLAAAFAGENIGVDEASDAYQFDLSFEEFWVRKSVLIVTPEKLLYLLRRQPDLADQIGLIIYDEGHQFDSPSRGAAYELLLTSLKLLLPGEAQKVLLSAVIANARQVADWLIGADSIVVDGEGLSPTSRSVAFASWSTRLGQLFYVDPLEPERDEFFVPRVIEAVELPRLPKERTPRHFPEQDGPSIGLYLGLKLGDRGSVAVFCGRKDTAANLCADALKLYRRGYDQPAPITYSNLFEVGRLTRLFAAHMGIDSEVAGAAGLGIFPHHANVPHGLRLSVEHAMKTGDARFVVCTSTLAQGVNLPIRYLIITGVYQGTDRILVRDFHNLIGRAGRAGMHSEGSVIFAQSQVYDQRRDYREGWRWKVAKDLLNPAMSEPSASSILLLFEPFTWGRPARGLSLNLEVAHELVFNDADLIEQDVQSQTKGEEAKVQQAYRRYLFIRARILHAIASFVLAHLDFEAENFADEAQVLCTNTLAYFSASAEQRPRLQALFRNIALHVAQNAPTPELRQGIRRSALSPDAVRQLATWLANNLAILIAALADDNLFEVIAPQLIEHGLSAMLQSMSVPEAAIPLAKAWISGASFAEMLHPLRLLDVRVTGKRRKVTVDDLVGMCEDGFGYEGAMLISTLADLAEEYDTGLSVALGRLQKRLKYGLPSAAHIAFYEVGFADRVVCGALANAFPHVLDRFTALVSLRSHRDVAAEVIQGFPAYFEAVLTELAPNQG